jgi:hypothetical protein
MVLEGGGDDCVQHKQRFNGVKKSFTFLTSN